MWYVALKMGGSFMEELQPPTLGEAIFQTRRFYRFFFGSYCDLQLHEKLKLYPLVI